MSKLIQQAMLNKMIVWYVILFTLNSLATSIITSFLHIDWTKLSGTEKFVLIWAILQSWTGVMLAFFNKASAKIKSGELDVDDLPPATENKQPEPPLHN